MPKRYTEAELAWRERRYRETGDPLFVWGAISECLRMEVSFPPFVLEYLGEASSRLMGLVDQDKRVRIKNPSQKVSDAMGFGPQRGKPTSFAAANRQSRDAAMADAVRMRMLWPLNAEPWWGEKEYVAVRNIALEFGVSETTVRSAVRKSRERLPRLWESSFAKQ